MPKNRFGIYPAIAAGLLVFLLFRLMPKEPNTDGIIVNRAGMSRTACLSEINDLFEGQVDSNKACDCILPASADMFKNHPDELRRLNQGDPNALSPATKDSLYTIFTHCVGPYVLDTTFKMHLSGNTLAHFKAQLAGKLKSQSRFNGINTDSLASSIIDRLNGNMTIQQFIGFKELDDSLLAGH